MPIEIDEQNKEQTPNDELTNETLSSTKLTDKSYDADTVTLETDGNKDVLRIQKVGGTEIDKSVKGFGKNVLRQVGVNLPKEGSGRAEFFRDGINQIFGDVDAEVDKQGVGVFGRPLGNMKIDGMDYRHLMYELGVSNRWTNYGYDTVGSRDDNTYKWYGGKTQATNIDAYSLLEEAPEPTAIIDDKTYGRINDLRSSLMAHMADANEGVLDKDEALAVAKELMHNPEALALAQKRRWYEKTRNSDVAKMMLDNWNVPFIRTEIKEQARVVGEDVSPRVDTSFGGIISNAFEQQFGDQDRYKFGSRSGSYSQGTFKEEFSDAQFDQYIAENAIPPDVATKMYDIREKSGNKAAIDKGEFELIDSETKAIGVKLDNQKAIVKSLVSAAAPYIVDPKVYVTGGAGGVITKRAAQFAYSRVTSPLTRKLATRTTVGGGVGLGESVGYTSNNYQEFTNEQLLTTWALDAAFGGAFSGVFAIGEMGVKAYGAKHKDKIAGEGLEDLNISNVGEPMDSRRVEEDAEFTVREQEEAAFKAEELRVQTADDEAYKAFVESSEEIRNRMIDMKDELAIQVQTGQTPELTTTVDVAPVQTIPKPEPVLTETVDGVETKTDVDTRTPEEIELAEDVWLAQQMEETLRHQSEVIQPKLAEVNANHNLVSRAVKAVGKGLGLEEFASKLIRHQDSKMSYIGTNILETGIGFGGKVNREHSAALTKDAIYTRSVGNLNKAYVDSISAWAMKQGASQYKAFKAAWEGGKVNEVARQFHRAAFLRQEARQMGKQVEPDEQLDKYLDQLNKTNDELFQSRIDAGIKGFDANRRIKNYIPHVWKKVKVGEIVKRHGEQVVLDLLTKSIEAAKKAGKITDNASTDELAERQLNWINGLGDSMEHIGEVGAGISGRGKSRIPLDFTTEHNGLSMLDLIDTDLPSVMDSYIQRAGADIGISKATNGLIRSEGDFIKFLTPEAESDKLLAQDAMDLLYGRPTRQGMSPEMRSMMDLVTIQQMGGIGVAQLAETGTMAQRLVVNYMSQPIIAKKIWKMAGEDMNDKGVLHQVRSISAVNDNMEYINRYSVNNIDQAQIDELSDIRAASIDSVDKLTLGAYKAQFGRMLGSLSGVNAVQKAQSRLLQASFSVDVARGFKFNKGTSTARRLNDLGLDDDGAVARHMRELVEFDADGFPTNFNFEKWDKEALDGFVHAMNREEAQLMPRVMAGELPVFMNKPLWQAIMQFRKTPLAFMSKGTQRNLQFADREAVLGTVLNAMTAGVTRYAKVAAAGGAYVALSDSEFQQPTMDQMQPYNYVSNFGILGDTYSLGQSWSKAYQQKDGIESLWEGAKAVPILSGIDNAYHALDGDPTAIKKAIPLNTLPLVNEVANAVIRNMEQ